MVKRKSGAELGLVNPLAVEPENTIAGTFQLIIVGYNRDGQMYTASHPDLMNKPEFLTDSYIEMVAERVAHTLRAVRNKALAAKGALSQ